MQYSNVFLITIFIFIIDCSPPSHNMFILLYYVWCLGEQHWKSKYIHVQSNINIFVKNLFSKVLKWTFTTVSVSITFLSLQNFQIYLPWESFYKDSPVLIGVLHWPGYVMVLNTLIPISLYIRYDIPLVYCKYERYSRFIATINGWLVRWLVVCDWLVGWLVSQTIINAYITVYWIDCLAWLTM